MSTAKGESPWVPDSFECFGAETDEGGNASRDDECGFVESRTCYCVELEHACRVISPSLGGLGWGFLLLQVYIGDSR